jgi:hypothetical protein
LHGEAALKMLVGRFTGCGPVLDMLAVWLVLDGR